MKPIRDLWPSERQWSTWSLPSKLTALGTLIGAISLLLYIGEKSVNLSHLWLVDNQLQHSPTAVKNSCEVADLIRMFGGKYDGWADWDIGSQRGTPIEWKTIGKNDDPPEFLGSAFGVFARQGSVVLTNDHKPIYEQLKQTIVAGEWDVWLIGPNAGVDLVMIESDYGDTLPFDIPNVLRHSGFHVTLFKGIEQRNTTGNFIIYRIEETKGKMVWVAESWSIGSAGGSQTIWIIYDQDTADRLWQVEGEPYTKYLLPSEKAAPTSTPLAMPKQ